MPSDTNKNRKLLELRRKAVIDAFEEHAPDLWKEYCEVEVGLTKLGAVASPLEFSVYTKIEPPMVIILERNKMAMRQVDIQRALFRGGYALDRENRELIIRGGVNNKSRTPSPYFKKGTGGLLGLASWGPERFLIKHPGS